MTDGENAQAHDALTNRIDELERQVLTLALVIGAGFDTLARPLTDPAKAREHMDAVTIGIDQVIDNLTPLPDSEDDECKEPL